MIPKSGYRFSEKIMLEEMRRATAASISPLLSQGGGAQTRGGEA